MDLSKASSSLVVRINCCPFLFSINFNGFRRNLIYCRVMGIQTSKMIISSNGASRRNRYIFFFCRRVPKRTRLALCVPFNNYNYILPAFLLLPFIYLFYYFCTSPIDPNYYRHRKTLYRHKYRYYAFAFGVSHSVLLLIFYISTPTLTHARHVIGAIIYVLVIVHSGTYFNFFFFNYSYNTNTRLALCVRSACVF